MTTMLASNGTVTSGWASSPNNRGTIDIILSCFFSIILCCWTTVCPNLPAISDNRWAQFRDKFGLACIGMLGPEFLFAIAVGQRTSARRSVKKFKGEGFHGWTLTHAFFADMGGFVLETSDMPVYIPLDTEQLFYLVKKKYIEYPKLSKDEINDKNKSDGLARLLTVVQAVWFLASTIARPIQGLAVSTLELTTISFIIVMFATSYCWFHKPSDISRPVILQCKTSMEQIRSEVQLYDPDDYRRTPLDFVNRECYVLDLIWEYYTNILSAMHLPIFSRPIRSRPHNRNRSDKFLRTELDFEIFEGIVILIFSATFLCAWNFHFPTQIERILWRCASAYSLIYGMIGGAYIWIWHLVLLDKHGVAQLPTTTDKHHTEKGIRHRLEALANKIRKVSAQEDQGAAIPLRLLFPVSFLCMFYCIFRIYILVEDAIALRSLPSSAFDTVNWWL